jgi:hypothetical protein
MVAGLPTDGRLGLKGLRGDDLDGFDWILRLRPRGGSTMAAKILIEISRGKNKEKTFSCRGGHATLRTEQERSIKRAELLLRSFG